MELVQLSLTCKTGYRLANRGCRDGPLLLWLPAQGRRHGRIPFGSDTARAPRYTQSAPAVDRSKPGATPADTVEDARRRC